MKKIVVLALSLCTAIAFAQKEKKVSFNKETNLVDVVYYHDNGAVSQVGFFNLDGKLEGNWVSYSEDGVKLVSAFYENGKKVGKWTYYIDGEIKMVSYSDNIASI